MGAGFVLLIFLFAIVVLAAATAIVAVIITAIASRKNNRKRAIIAAAFAPFLFFLSFYFLGLGGSIVVSAFTGVDLGVGDTWYLPLDDRYQLVMIDDTAHGFIQDEDRDLNVSVTQIAQFPNKVYGSDNQGQYFSLDLHLNKLIKYPNEDQFLKAEGVKKQELKLQPIADFYYARKSELAGNWFMAAGILSLFFSALLTWAFCRLVLFGTLRGRR